jgi:hypothetical protein
MHKLLNSWSRHRVIVAGIAHQGWDVQITAYAARDWRANFFPAGIAHSILGGSAWEPTLWRAVPLLLHDAAADADDQTRKLWIVCVD